MTPSVTSIIEARSTGNGYIEMPNARLQTDIGNLRPGTMLAIEVRSYDARLLGAVTVTNDAGDGDGSPDFKVCAYAGSDADRSPLYDLWADAYTPVGANRCAFYAATAIGVL